MDTPAPVQKDAVYDAPQVELRNALIVTESNADYIYIGKRFSSFLRSAGYSVVQIEDYHDVQSDIRSGRWDLVVYVGLGHIFANKPETRIVEMRNGPVVEFVPVSVYHCRDCEIIQDMRSDPQIPVPRILFRTTRPSSGEITWHCSNLPGISIVSGPVNKEGFLSVVEGLMRME